MCPPSQVLVVDDDELTREMLQASLAGAYEVTAVGSGREAVDLAHAHAPDLVLLDVDMPDMNGYATCEALKAESGGNDLPVIFLSGCINIEERLRGYRVGANDYLTKPFDVPELLAKISLAISQRDKNRDLNHQIEDVMNAAMTSADMYGEVGVVLEFQRRLSECRTYQQLAKAVFDALERSRFEGCLRLRGRQGLLSCTALAECSALENSILDHLEKLKGANMQPVGDNTSFNYGPVLLLVRNLPMGPSALNRTPEETERLGRARDNIALIVEGALARIRSLDIEMENSSLGQTQRLVSLTRETLIDITAQQHATRMQIVSVFERMREEIEQSFIHLGLSESQENLLADTLKRYVQEAMTTFDQSDRIEAHLRSLIDSLNSGR